MGSPRFRAETDLNLPNLIFIVLHRTTVWETLFMFRKAVCALLPTVLACCPGFAQDWAGKMFETRDHDFGSVARSAKEEFEFVLTNIYVEDVHIAGVRSSCGCAQVRMDKRLLKTYEKGAVIASLNTKAFRGSRGATITVTFDKPFHAEVQLHVRGYIRSDVVLHPGSVQMGRVDQGQPARQKVAVTYAGRRNWQILEVKSANPHLAGEAVETRRSGGQVAYELTVYLDAEAPAGYLRDHLVLVTNDRRSREIPVPVEGVVQAGIVVNPTSLFMGVVQPGQKVTKQLVVRGKKPFRILSVDCDDDSFEFGTSAEQEPKALHVIRVTFMAGQEPGKVTKMIHIRTDLGETPPDLSAYAVVAP